MSSAILQHGYYLLDVKTSATAPAVTASSAIMREGVTEM